MKYFFIYSAGGGAGDWNGVKRIWNDKMPLELKSNILLKFGDVYYNHASSTNLIKPTKWRDVSNLRDWLYEATEDDYIYSENCNILLDSGTSKIVSFITHHNPNIEPEDIILEFDSLLNEYEIFNKYVEIINNSNITYAVTFDIPNTFKIRSQNGNTRRLHFNAQQESEMISRCIFYCNELYNRLGNQDKVLTTFSATWSIEGIARFIRELNYIPNKLAIGGISDERNLENVEEKLRRINELLDFSSYDFIHFLGCGGFKKVQRLKDIGFSSNNVYSVDNSTPMNRAIDGNTSGTSQSAYICYESGDLIRIQQSTVEDILFENQSYDNPLYDQHELSNILNLVLQHQNHNSSEETYNARAQLSFHNHDVFRQNALE